MHWVISKRGWDVKLQYYVRICRRPQTHNLFGLFTWIKEFKDYENERI